MHRATATVLSAVLLLLGDMWLSLIGVPDTGPFGSFALQDGSPINLDTPQPRQLTTRPAACQSAGSPPTLLICPGSPRPPREVGRFEVSYLSMPPAPLRDPSTCAPPHPRDLVSATGAGGAPTHPTDRFPNLRPR